MSIKRQVRDRGTGTRLTERTRRLIPETRSGIPKGTISYSLRNEDDVGGRAREIGGAFQLPSEMLQHKKHEFNTKITKKR